MIELTEEVVGDQSVDPRVFHDHLEAELQAVGAERCRSQSEDVIGLDLTVQIPHRCGSVVLGFV